MMYEHERPARPCPKCGDGRRIYLGANFARCRACGWAYAFELAVLTEGEGTP